MDDRLRRAPVGVLEVDDEGRVDGVNDAAREVVDPDGDPVGAPVEDAFPRSVEESLRRAFDGGVDAAEFEEYYPDLDRWLAVSVVPADGGAVVYVRDVTERRRNEQTVQRLRAERERTAAIDDLLSTVVAELADATSRGEIAETICAALGGTDRYEFAWVGEREVGGGDLVVRTAAGDTGETFDAVRETVESGATTPEERAVERGDLQVVAPLADDPRAPEAVRRAGFADGVQSALAMPLVHESNVHGVVGVYASGEDAFSERERRSFETLGEIGGFAVTAARNRSLLLADAVTEVAFEVEDCPLASLSAETGAELTLDGLVDHGDGGLLCYLSVAGAAGADVVAAAADAAAFGDARVLREGDAADGVELEVRGATPLRAASSLGGTVRNGSFDGGAGRVVVEFPPDGDVRRMADVVRRAFDADVAAKRERERPVRTAREFRDDLGGRLTDRQETALRTAYLADYFESPRGSTAEEVAASLDITGSTLLYHLRAGQRKLLDAFFEADAGGRE